MKKLTDAMKRRLEKLASYYPEALRFSSLPATLSTHKALERRGMIKFMPGEGYHLLVTGAEAIGRADLLPLYDAYKTYRKIAWDGGYTALSYEDWYKVQPESGRAELAAEPA